MSCWHSAGVKRAGVTAKPRAQSDSLMRVQSIWETRCAISEWVAVLLIAVCMKLPPNIRTRLRASRGEIYPFRCSKILCCKKRAPAHPVKSPTNDKSKYFYVEKKN